MKTIEGASSGAAGCARSQRWVTWAGSRAAATPALLSIVAMLDAVRAELNAVRTSLKMCVAVANRGPARPGNAKLG